MFLAVGLFSLCAIVLAERRTDSFLIGTLTRNLMQQGLRNSREQTTFNVFNFATTNIYAS